MKIRHKLMLVYAGYPASTPMVLHPQAEFRQSTGFGSDQMNKRPMRQHPTFTRRTILGGTAIGLATGATSMICGIGSASAQSPAGHDDRLFTNGIGMEFVPIPAGRFMMGSPDSDRDGRIFEKPRHEITISKPFYLGRYEVTQAQWDAVLNENPYNRDRSNPYYNLQGMRERITRPDHPATVSWNDAQEFITALNRMEGGNRYRLPSEAEWEYAARAGTETRYSFGNSDTGLESHAWFGGDFDTGGTHPVGQKRPNPWGLYDIHGNAWEWVRDWYDADYYANSPSNDPQGPDTGQKRVVRGGSWHATANSWRSAFRRDYAPDYRGISIGFRVLRTAD
jgi:formylglycine-generating enzyme required for sulfatase activity